jgi:YggT family protein
MIFGANFILSVAKVLGIILTTYFWLVTARALVSWVNPDPFNPIVQLLQKITEPVLAPIRNKLARLQWNVGIDFSPFIVILIIIFLENFLISSLVDIAYRLK